ncbi:fumarylacetoacetate hydrolase family protein [Amycolatopsis rhabdoformis]|uniref:Fumarylacetoacetate hydrolase family protein n=1 Tax=Amycolatopsis rhabdoformis TaxID=1448059 RepID=A0ABZ1I022_9PSEU|nr:fumarylacetoacetate hydrolase family protein [Amycolatopsis rhabdoformis]WSE27146.1 fumarylacetoacetate hydrolase family protein [Amycolatopsis rhabdoformis]
MSDDFAARLDEAATTRTPCAQLPAGLSLDDAYAVQRQLVDLRLARGERSIGVKLGFTSKAKAAQMGVADVIIGRLTSGMVLADGDELDLSRLIHPRAEPEVAFRLSRAVEPGEVPGPDLIDAVAPAIEIIDSRYRDFKFSLADVVADNTSAAAFVLGPWRALDAGLDNRGVLFEVDGRLVASGSTAAILGDPLRAIPAAVRMAQRHGLPLTAGTVLLAGAATPAVAFEPGTQVSATVSGLGRARFSVKAREEN